jgi:hypothetical protein
MEHFVCFTQKKALGGKTCSSLQPSFPGQLCGSITMNYGSTLENGWDRHLMLLIATFREGVLILMKMVKLAELGASV